jgi:hypothetical protein
VSASSQDICPKPFERTVFKLIEIYCHQKATKFMYDNPNAAIRKFSFGELFSSAWKKGTQVGNVVRGFECAGIFLLTLPLPPKTNFYPLYTFYKIQPTSFSEYS